MTPYEIIAFSFIEGKVYIEVQDCNTQEKFKFTVTADSLMQSRKKEGH